MLPLADINKSEELWIILRVLSDKDKILLLSLLRYQLNNFNLSAPKKKKKKDHPNVWTPDSNLGLLLQENVYGCLIIS